MKNSVLKRFKIEKNYLSLKQDDFEIAIERVYWGVLIGLYDKNKNLMRPKVKIKKENLALAHFEGRIMKVINSWLKYLEEGGGLHGQP
jgi:hypothetical protein